MQNENTNKKLNRMRMEGEDSENKIKMKNA